MITDLLYRKRLGIPYLSFLLVISCLMVSIATCFSKNLYFVFGGVDAPNYPWQNLITCLFEHGSFFVEIGIQKGLSLSRHLITNLLVVLLFGCISERVMGTKKFLILSVIAAIANDITRYTIKSYGNGISGIVWSYAPIVLFIVVILFKRYGNRLWHDTMMYICLFLFFMMWIVISGASEWTTNLFHFVATAIGFFFTILWKKDISYRMTELFAYNKERTMTDIRLVIASLSIPLFLSILLFLTGSRIIA